MGTLILQEAGSRSHPCSSEKMEPDLNSDVLYSDHSEPVLCDLRQKASTSLELFFAGKNGDDNNSTHLLEESVRRPRAKPCVQGSVGPASHVAGARLAGQNLHSGPQAILPLGHPSLPESW